MIFRFRAGALFGEAAFAVKRFASIALVSAVLVGCGGEESRPVTRRSPQRDLPELGEYMVPLHDGRLEVAPPKGWEIGSRRTGFVIWFKKSQKSSYPCILISAEDYDATPTVTDKNVRQFASEIRDRLKESGKSVKEVDPLEIGSFYGVTYRRVAKTKEKFKPIILDRMFVQTAVDGQLYTFELRSPQDKFAAVENAVYAVAAGAKFPKSEAKEPTEEEPPEKKAAEKERADDDTEAEKVKAEPKKPSAKKTEPPKKEPEKKKPAKKKKAQKKKDGDSEFELLDDDEL